MDKEKIAKALYNMDTPKILLILRNDTESGYEQYGNSGEVVMTYFDEETASTQLKELIEKEVKLQVKAERKRIINCIKDLNIYSETSEDFEGLLADFIKEQEVSK